MERKIIRKAKTRENPYVQIMRKALQDCKLSLKAKGLLAYILSLPDDWKIYQSELSKHFTDGKFAIQGAFNELKEAGYIKSQRIKDERGYFAGHEYLVYEDPGENEEWVEPLSGRDENVQDEIHNLMLRKAVEMAGYTWTENMKERVV